MYIIAQKLVHKSNEDGYIVGSKGISSPSFTSSSPQFGHFLSGRSYPV